MISRLGIVLVHLQGLNHVLVHQLRLDELLQKKNHPLQRQNIFLKSPEFELVFLPETIFNESQETVKKTQQKFTTLIEARYNCK